MELTPGMLSGLVGGTTVVALGAFRVVEAVVRKIGNGKGNGDVAEANATVRQLCEQVHDLHQWHNVKDAEGRMLWFFPHKDLRDLTAAIKELTHEFRNGKCPRAPEGK